MDESGNPTIQEKLARLEPTQMTVGYAEVVLKREDWQQRSQAHREKLLATHLFPAVRGPEGRYFITDHHHLGRALIEESVDGVQLQLVSDLSHLAADEFWVVMDHNQWVHPYDSNGQRRNFADVPQSLLDLADDPYRSLAAKVRRAGGYQKDLTPFAEFLWADFFRRRIPASQLTSDPNAALQEAIKLAQTSDAAHLPDS
ncbi:MAG: chromosome partitioning protein ParB [Methylobacteriaceae bacterium]|nr:chromosome partitioning protein ParB [Methylobacteriaceae bacterium]